MSTGPKAPAGGFRTTFRTWLKSIVRPVPQKHPVPPGVHERFRVFRRLLDRNNQILKLMADMEEKARGEYLFDRSYILGSLETLRIGLEELAADLAAIGGRQYLPLRERIEEILMEAGTLAGRAPPTPEDRFVRPFAELDSGKLWSVGSKNAQLGEMAKRGGLPIPGGFAVTAWAYRRFLEEAGLQKRITEMLRSLDLRSFAQLVEVSGKIRDMVLSTPVPADVSEAIVMALDELGSRRGIQAVAVRSSAIGEDGVLSFAGQYRSELNVPLDEGLEAYRRVLAGKFTPGAIYYLLSQSLEEADAPMAVGFAEMIDAAAAGVVYTRDPVDASREVLVVQAVRGLGSALVSGQVSPIFTVSRAGGQTLDARIVSKDSELVLAPGGGTTRREIPREEREIPSLSPDQVSRLAQLALQAEGLYGGPRDIEWVLARDGRLLLLQCRPLRVFQHSEAAMVADPGGARVLAEGGLTASPGAGTGTIHRITSPSHMADVPPGSVVVAERPMPGLVAIMDRVAAIVCRVGGSACHMATLARERGVPTIVGLEEMDALRTGRTVTVDATAGTVYEGSLHTLVEARRSQLALTTEEPIFALLQKVLGLVTPLNLIHPADPGFTIERCSTVHDVTRFAHQKAMEEMFRSAWSGRDTRRMGVQLRSSLPLPVTIVHLERDLETLAHRGHVQLAQAACPPFEAFWSGMEQEGWPRPPAADGRGFLSVMTTHMARSTEAEFLEDSFAIVTEEYMILSLRMGYHFTTVEALCTEDPSRNTIRMQYKDGGAALDRRVRRIRLIDGLLRRLGFESASAGDFLDASLSWVPRDRTLKILRTLGRLNIRTKQLDMALTNDEITAWYEDDLARKLGLGESGAP